jgi:hypothetical protein
MVEEDQPCSSTFKSRHDCRDRDFGPRQKTGTPLRILKTTGKGEILGLNASDA